MAPLRRTTDGSDACLIADRFARPRGVRDLNRRAALGDMLTTPPRHRLRQTSTVCLGIRRVA